MELREVEDSPGIFDWERMAEVVKNGRPEIKGKQAEDLQESTRLPTWLRLLWRRLTLLQRLQQMAILAPITPVPNPLRLEAVLGGKIMSWGSQAFDALQLWGQTILQLLFSIVLFVEHPFDDAGLLSRRVEAAQSESRLAALIANSTLLAETLFDEGADPQGEGIEAETAASMLKALIGAYASEKGGDFYSVVKLWQWLSEGKDELKTSIRYLSCATQTFNGRTPTYEHFSEVEHKGTVCLQVYYENRGTVLYRRPEVSKGRSYGQELLLYASDAEWKDVRYDDALGAFVSPSIMEDWGGSTCPPHCPTRSANGSGAGARQPR